MDLCLLCLQIDNKSEKAVSAESTQWLEENIESIIEKHFWPLKSLTSHSWLCMACWQVLSDFHKFYKRIEDAHTYFSSTALKTETQELRLEEDKKNENDVSEEANVLQDSQCDLDVPWMDQSLDSDSANEEEKLDAPKKEIKNEENLINEEVPIPVRRQSKRKDPLKKPASTRKYRKVNAIKSSKRKRKGTTKTEISITETNDDAEQTTLLEQVPKIESNDGNLRNCDDMMDVNEMKSHSNYSYKPSLQHQEQDDFVAENFNIICGICQAPMETFYQVCLHAAQEHNQRGFVKCCNKKFYRRIILVEHIRWHLDPERFKCKECGKILSDRRCLQVHARLHVQRDRNYTCDVCGKGFARPLTLQRHKYTHIPDEERKIPCEQCDKKFANNNLLMEHVRSVHLHNYSVVCDICGKEIRSKAVFKRHMLQHEGLNTTETCDICGLKISDKRRLKVHKQTQHTEKDNTEYKCHICSKVSASLSALKQHVQYNHETGYDFKCTICDKAFKRSSTLKEHMATHTGTVLYTCPYCPKTFNSNANMYTHRKKAHPEKWEEAFREKYSGNLPPKYNKSSVAVDLAQNHEHTRTIC